MTATWTGRGFEGVKEVITGSGAADAVGRYAASVMTGVEPRVDFIRYCLSLDGDLQSKDELCLQGFLLAIGDDSLAEVLQAAAEGVNANIKVNHLAGSR